MRALQLFLSAAGLVTLAAAESPYTEARSSLENWVETRQLISKTRTDWQAAKESLEQSAQLFERELAAVREQSTKLSTNNTQIDKERVEAETSLKASQEALARAKEFASQFEAQVKALLPGLPAPLQEILRPLVLRLPTEADSKTTAAERLQVLVGILNELDKFNSGISVFNEKRRNGKGEEVAVETVYVGLGAAYFVNERGDFAGIGTAGAKGWDWQARPEIASSVREVIRIYRNERPARFVSLPATIR